MSDRERVAKEMAEGEREGGEDRRRGRKGEERWSRRKTEEENDGDSTTE
jgi:hypothetical protein